LFIGLLKFIYLNPLCGYAKGIPLEGLTVLRIVFQHILTHPCTPFRLLSEDNSSPLLPVPILLGRGDLLSPFEGGVGGWHLR
jgi:hypothetical protein